MQPGSRDHKYHTMGTLVIICAEFLLLKQLGFFFYTLRLERDRVIMVIFPRLNKSENVLKWSH